ncbi:hypothetical protein DTL42_19450 [Bremerella cremea]|uniref:Uncharacterized protein n=1 Tax=Bremerella cremea TaxID=1031537 RepID=A0A368KPG6_9BACT|nr:hypothetical protein DTL42_19450 [Bremerella cremea]
MDSIAPIEQSGLSYIGNNTYHPTPDLTSYIDDSLPIRLALNLDSTAGHTPDAGMTLIGEVTSTVGRDAGIRIYQDDSSIDASESTGTRGFTPSSTSGRITGTIILAPPRDDAPSSLTVAAVSELSSGNSGTVSVAAPSGTTTGSLLLAMIEWDSYAGSITPVSDWEELVLDISDSNRDFWVGYRIVEGGDPDPYTWNFGTVRRHAAVILRLEGFVDSPSIIASAGSFYSSGSVYSFLTPTIEATSPPYGFVYFALFASDAMGYISPPESGELVAYAEQPGNDASINAFLGKIAQRASGTTPARNISVRSSTDALAVTVAVQILAAAINGSAELTATSTIVVDAIVIPEISSHLTATASASATASVSGAPVDGQADLEGEGFVTAEGSITTFLGSGFSPYLSEKMLEMTFRGIPFTPVTTVYLAFCTSDESSITELPAVNGYSRQVVSFGAPENSGTKTQVTNVNSLTFGPATTAWPDITHYQLRDAPTGGNLLYQFPISPWRDNIDGDVFSFDPNGLRVQLD